MSEGYQTILNAAQAHGMESEPDHEVGDLQDALIAAWKLLSSEQRVALVNGLDLWGDDEDDEEGEV